MGVLQELAGRFKPGPVAARFQREAKQRKVQQQSGGQEKITNKNFNT